MNPGNFKFLDITAVKLCKSTVALCFVVSGVHEPVLWFRLCVQEAV